MGTNWNILRIGIEFDLSKIASSSNYKLHMIVTPRKNGI